MLQALGLAAQGPRSPAFRIRLGLHQAALRSHDVDLRLLPLLSDNQERIFRRGNPYAQSQVVLAARRSLSQRLEGATAEVAVIQRQIDLLPSLTLEHRAAAGRRLVLDVDDAIWLDGNRHAGGHPLAVLKGTRRKLTWLARRADQVIAGNEFLAEWFSTHTQAVTVIPSTVDLEDVPLGTHEAGRTVILGWIGSLTTAPYIHQLAPVLAGLCRSAKDFDFELHVVGADMPAVAGVRIVAQPWTEAAERSALRRMDIGLMPLPDNRWTRHKCAYKALQYMAAGVPVVADDVGISADLIADGEAGLIVCEAGEWIEAIVNLAHHPRLRARLGAAGRRRVEDDFSTRRWAPVLAAAIRG